MTETEAQGLASNAVKAPCVRRTILVSLRSAALSLWGPAGLEAIGSVMESDVRRDTVLNPVISADWLPEKYVMNWYEAAWEKGANRNQTDYLKFLDVMMDHGFGRVRKFLLGIASPKMVYGKAQELWRHDHSHGKLTTEFGDHSCDIRLFHHVYTTTPLSRMSIAEIYRYAGALARTPQMTGKHFLEADGVLRVHVEWE